MTESNEEGQPAPIVREHDFLTINQSALFADCVYFDCYRVSEVLRIALDDEKYSKCRPALAILQAIATFHERFDEPHDPYGPLAQFDGKRSAIPSDFKGAQTQELARFVPHVTNTTLRARLADVVWLNDRKLKDVAQIAITSYAEKVRKHLNGELVFRTRVDSLIDRRVFSDLKRAFDINKAIKGKSTFESSLIDAYEEIFSQCVGSNDAIAIRRISEITLRYKLREPTDIIEILEGSLRASKSIDPHSEKATIELIASIHSSEGNDDAVSECRIRVAECSVAMAEKMSGSAMAAAGWIKTAISELRRARGPRARDRVRELRIKLRELQEDSLFELGVIETPIDLKPFIESVHEELESAGLADALGYFASMYRSPKVDDMKDAARDVLKEGFLSNFFTSEFLDSDGKTIAKKAGVAHGEEGELDTTQKILERYHMLRTLVVRGQIEPARILIQQNFSCVDEAMRCIADHSPFVPPDYEYLFYRGFTQFMRGNMIEAGSILLPQMENSFRYVLAVNGIDSSTIESDLTQEDRSIGKLIDLNRDSLIEIFGEDLIFEIDHLFSIRPGPSLRNEMAHGKLSSATYFGNDVIYACWLILRICCLPLFGRWADVLKGVDEAPAS